MQLHLPVKLRCCRFHSLTKEARCFREEVVLTTTVPRPDLEHQSDSWSGGSGEKKAVFVATEGAIKLSKAGTKLRVKGELRAAV